MTEKIRRLRVITNAKLPELKPGQSLRYEGRDWTFLGVLNRASNWPEVAVSDVADIISGGTPHRKYRRKNP